ncbi:putative maleylacetate reductase [Aaosphaeria arxii CBS 175.79]|uniref:Putative maleylacetate reductase n=1 Tax=Aaosphaeria arxii CBS 175.79 TaxID=1450172 RepID=A0A6A5X782_9PLEO|nr:putative maleylacetate reductase [Aaosphaeria arxii CBS 175.79]KAF2008780.1 putative maleylacetate reductase [Aaosphaeria arxii CBS 175.79]
MSQFTYTANPSRVIFGSGTLSQIATEVSTQGFTAAMILCTPYQVDDARRIEHLLGAKASHIFSEATMHTPTSITEKALAIVENKKVDCLVSIGGGSTTGLGKAISIRTGIYHICIPTTYAGSEMTSILGQTSQGLKTTIKDPRVLPGTVIYDVDLTKTLPAGLSATSGINAIAHAAEALYAPDSNPIIRLIAREGIRALAEALPDIMKDQESHDARYKALYGAWLCGMCLGSTTMSLHHKLCHTLGGSFDLPHAETHTILLPHTLAYNCPAAPTLDAELAELLPGGYSSGIEGLNRLLDQLNVKRALKDFWFNEDDIDRAASIAMENQYANPRKVEREKICELLRRAWAGEPARVDG